jgi:ABC-2 type transport system permease protein
MSPAVIIARVNLRRALGDSRLMLVSTLLPVALIFVTGLVSGAVRAPVGVVNLGSGPADARLMTLLGDSGALTIRVEATPADLDADILRSRVVAGLIVPRSFGTAAALRASFVSQSDQSAALTAHGAVLGVLDELASEERAAGPGQARAPLETLVDRAVRLHTGSPPMSPFSYVGPADLVLFMGVTLLVLSVGIVETRRLGVLRRILAAPVPAGAVVAGVIGGLLFIAAGQAAGLVLVGRALFGVHWGDPLAVFLVVAALAVALAGGSTLLGTIARTHEQALGLAIVIAVVAGMLGGCMWSLDTVGPLMRAIGHATPQAWAVDGLVDTVFNGAGVRTVLPDVAVLAGFGVVLCTLATLRLRATLNRS